MEKIKGNLKSVHQANIVSNKDTEFRGFSVCSNIYIIDSVHLIL